MEGGTPAGGATLQLGGNAGYGQGFVDQDGNFTLNASLPPSIYRIHLQSAPSVYLKQIEAQGAKLSGDEIEIAAGASVQLSLVASTGTTKIEGIAATDDKPCGGAMILLIPKDRSRSEFYRRDQSDSDGTFTLNDVPPGRYTLVAIDDGHDLAYREQSVIDPYLPSGVELTLPLQSDSHIKVTVGSRKQ